METPKWPVQPVWAYVNPHRKIHFLTFKQNFLYLYLLLLAYSLYITEKSLSCPTWPCPAQHCLLVRTPLFLLFLMINNLNSLSLSLYSRCPNFFASLCPICLCLPYWRDGHVCLVLSSTTSCGSPAVSLVLRWRITSLSFLVVLFLMQS